MAGLFLRNTIDDTTTVTGITAGHVVDKGNSGRAIYQPPIKSFQKQHKILRDRLDQLKSMPVRKDPAPPTRGSTSLLTDPTSDNHFLSWGQINPLSNYEPEKKFVLTI
jgi:hypothetical protein